MDDYRADHDSEKARNRSARANAAELERRRRWGWLTWAGGIAIGAVLAVTAFLIAPMLS